MEIQLSCEKSPIIHVSGRHRDKAHNTIPIGWHCSIFKAALNLHNSITKRFLKNNYFCESLRETDVWSQEYSDTLIG